MEILSLKNTLNFHAHDSGNTNFVSVHEFAINWQHDNLRNWNNDEPIKFNTLEFAMCVLAINRWKEHVCSSGTRLTSFIHFCWKSVLLHLRALQLPRLKSEQSFLLHHSVFIDTIFFWDITNKQTTKQLLRLELSPVYMRLCKSRVLLFYHNKLKDCCPLVVAPSFIAFRFSPR